MTMLRWRASSYAQDRARPSQALCNTGRSHTGYLCLHRGLLQSNPSSLRHRLYQPDRDGAKSSLTLSIFRGKIILLLTRWKPRSFHSDLPSERSDAILKGFSLFEMTVHDAAPFLWRKAGAQ